MSIVKYRLPGHCGTEHAVSRTKMMISISTGVLVAELDWGVKKRPPSAARVWELHLGMSLVARSHSKLGSFLLFFWSLLSSCPLHFLFFSPPFPILWSLPFFPLDSSLSSVPPFLSFGPSIYYFQSFLFFGSPFPNPLAMSGTL